MSFSKVLNESTNIPSHHPPSRGSSSWRSATTSRASSAPASPVFNETPKSPQSSLRCGVVVHKLDQGMAGRANSIKAYTELNRLVCTPQLLILRLSLIHPSYSFSRMAPLILHHRHRHLNIQIPRRRFPLTVSLAYQLVQENEPSSRHLLLDNIASQVNMFV